MKTRALFLHAIMAILVFCICPGVHAEQLAQDAPKPAANLILMIGDGVGPSVVGLARDYARTIENRKLWIERAMSEGDMALMQTPALGVLVTDSAASATAMATGIRTANGTVSLSAGRKPLRTILELAKQDGRATGLVTTTRLTHATPACFVAHIDDRDAEAEIAEQMLTAGVDVMLGGGLRYWIPAGAATGDFAGFEGKSARKDEVNLVEKAGKAGYSVVTNGAELADARGADRLLGFFANSHMPYALDRRPDDGTNVPSLVEMTEAALGVLSKNEKGFFLMVEGGRIDHAAHANDAAAMIADMMEFDEAVGAALAFAKRQGRTAVFITADHATGGPSLSARYSDDAGRTIYPNGENLGKLSRQDASFEYILTALAKNPSPAELKRLVAKHASMEISDADTELILRGEPLAPFHVIKPEYRRYGYPALAMGRVLGIEYGIAWSTAEHFSEPVLLIGCGAGSDLVHGYIENTAIFSIMRTAGGF